MHKDGQTDGWTDHYHFKLFIYVYNVQFVGNICKLMLIPIVLTYLNVILPIRFYLIVK